MAKIIVEDVYIILYSNEFIDFPRKRERLMKRTLSAQFDIHSVMVYKGQLIRDTRQNWATGHGTTSTPTPKIKGQACPWHQRATMQYC